MSLKQLNKYMVTALPEGYTSSKDEMDFRRKFIWTNEKGEDIIFKQSVLHNTSINRYRMHRINMLSGTIYRYFLNQRNMQTVIWDNGKYLFIRLYNPFPMKMGYEWLKV